MLYSRPPPVSEGRCPFSYNGHSIISIPELQSRYLPSTHTSKTGARNWQSPSYRLFSTSTMEPNSKPRAFSLSTMPWQKAWILLTILFHMAVMALRNSSF